MASEWAALIPTVDLVFSPSWHPHLHSNHNATRKTPLPLSMWIDDGRGNNNRPKLSRGFLVSVIAKAINNKNSSWVTLNHDVPMISTPLPRYSSPPLPLIALPHLLRNQDNKEDNHRSTSGVTLRLCFGALLLHNPKSRLNRDSFCVSASTVRTSDVRSTQEFCSRSTSAKF